MKCLKKNYYAGLSASFPRDPTSYVTTDDSETDGASSNLKKGPKLRNAFGEAKTSRYNRPPRDKKILDEREKIATRCSHRIKQLLDEKKKLDEVYIILLNIHTLMEI